MTRDGPPTGVFSIQAARLTTEWEGLVGEAERIDANYRRRGLELAGYQLQPNPCLPYSECDYRATEVDDGGFPRISGGKLMDCDPTILNSV